MDDKLSQLKEKQAEIGDKISLLQETNKRKDEEAAEIRQLIQECRENLSRIKGASPCSENKSTTGYGNAGAPCSQGRFADDQARAPCSQRTGMNDQARVPCSQRTAANDQAGAKRPCGPSGPSKSRCKELLAKKDIKSDAASRKKKKNERVSCKVDLNRMKVRVRGPSEDLKKLDATQLINLLEKFECQELIINTGDEIIKDPGEVRLIYLLHPGNIAMIVSIIMMAFLINANMCHMEGNNSARLILNMLYVSSSAFHYGMVLWMIIIRGYALRFGLNHDAFHLVDNIILPKYFCVCVLLSILSLYSFLATHCVSPCSSWPLDVITQIAIIVMTFFVELTTICYIIPALIRLRDITDDYIFDEEEPDCDVPQSYEKNQVKLRKLSWTLCLINFLTLLLLGANIYYITSKLNVCCAN